jgi:hypothetical protein
VELSYEGVCNVDDCASAQLTTDADGMLDLTPFYTGPGPWEVRLSVTDGDMSEVLTLPACVDAIPANPPLTCADASDAGGD